MEKIKLAEKIIKLLGIEGKFIQSVDTSLDLGIDITVKFGESSSNMQINERFKENGFDFFFITTMGTVVFHRKVKGNMTPVTIYIRSN